MDSSSDNLTLWGNLLGRLSTYSFDRGDKTIWKFYGVPLLYFLNPFILCSFAGKDVMKPLLIGANSEVITAVLL
jgi:hypothetical protein